MLCVICGSAATVQCSVCRTIPRYYCSSACQRIDWPSHQLQHQTKIVPCQCCGMPTAEIRTWHRMTFCCCSDACFGVLTEKVNLSTDMDGRIIIGHDSHVGRFVTYLYKLFGIPLPAEPHTILPVFIGTGIASMIKSKSIDAGIDAGTRLDALRAEINEDDRNELANNITKENIRKGALEAMIGWACEEGHLLTLVALAYTYNQFDLGYNNNYPFRAAALNGHTTIVIQLLNGLSKFPWQKNEREFEQPRLVRIDPTAVGNYALRWACAKGHETIVQLLLADNSVDASAKGNEPIRRATQTGRINIVRMLLEWQPADGRRVDVNDNNRVDVSAIKTARLNGYTQILRLLEEHDRKTKVLPVRRNTPNQSMLDAVKAAK